MGNSEIKTGFWVDGYVYVCPNSYELDIYPPNKGRTDKFTFTANGNEIGYFDVEADTYEEIKAKAEEFIMKWDAANKHQILQRSSLEAEMFNAIRQAKQAEIDLKQCCKDAVRVQYSVTTTL